MMNVQDWLPTLYRGAGERLLLLMNEVQDGATGFYPMIYIGISLSFLSIGRPDSCISLKKEPAEGFEPATG